MMASAPQRAARHRTEAEMSTLSELIEKGKAHRVTFAKSNGEKLFELALLWVVILALGAPQLAVLVLVLAVLSLIQIRMDGRPLELMTLGDKAADEEPGDTTPGEEQVKPA
jgi:hypothetical protein